MAGRRSQVQRGGCHSELSSLSMCSQHTQIGAAPAQTALSHIELPILSEAKTLRGEFKVLTRRECRERQQPPALVSEMPSLFDVR